jgi:hypothetical protein
MDGASSMHKKLKSAYTILVLKGRDHLGDLRHQWRIILKWILKKVYKNMERIHMAQNKDQWQTLANMIINFWFHKR